MSDSDPAAAPQSRRLHVSWLALAALLLAAGIVGGLVARSLFSPSRPQSHSVSRPIVQIVRQQPGLPSVADLVDTLCPSVAIIIPASEATAPSLMDSNSSADDVQFPAFAVSADGWLLTSAAVAQANNLDVLLGDGRRTAITEVRSDAVSGLAIVKTEGQTLAPIPLEDQAAARVGDFGFSLQTRGSGCSAEPAMVGSDFLADGGGSSSYIRLEPGVGDWSDGTPFLSGDGQVIGVSTTGTDGALIPAPLAAIVVDELIRNSLSPTTQFGFRATDFAQALSARLGDFRSRGAGVALIEAKSGAARAGLQAGDIVVAVDGSPVSSASELGRALDADSKTAKLDINRAGQQLSLSITRS